MSTLLTNRVQSAYSRTSHRSESDGQDARIKQRPASSTSTHQPYPNVFDQAALRALESSRPAHHHLRRAKTVSISTVTSTRPSSRKLRSDEIESLLRSLDRDDTYIVQVDCLANYRTLVQTIDLRKTPIDCQLLCALQQRENRIVQGNAVRDTRFLSLMELLQPQHKHEAVQPNNSNDANRSVVSEYQPSNLSY